MRRRSRTSCAGARRLGDLGILIGSRETLDQYVTETWARTHVVTLAPKTARTYAVLYDLRIGPYLGPFKLSELTPELVARWQADRIAAGAERTAVRKALSLPGAILQLGLESERVARNPVRMVRKVARPPRREVRPLPPATIEAMRAACGLRDATLISVLAYAGLRPGEALDLR
jgi:integrase